MKIVVLKCQFFEMLGLVLLNCSCKCSCYTQKNICFSIGNFGTYFIIHAMVHCINVSHLLKNATLSDIVGLFIPYIQQINFATLFKHFYYSWFLCYMLLKDRSLRSLYNWHIFPYIYPRKFKFVTYFYWNDFFQEVSLLLVNFFFFFFCFGIYFVIIIIASAFFWLVVT